MLFFGEFRFDVAQGRLYRGATELTLRPKTLGVLRHLLQHAGEIVSKESLVATVWDGVHVSEAVLHVCINELRRALDDDRREPSCIRTAYGRGYHFVARVDRDAQRDVNELAQELSDQLAEYPAEQTEAALMHLLEKLSVLFDAQQASWSAAVRLPVDASDPLHGWRPCVLRSLRKRDGVRNAFERGRARLESGTPPDLSTRRQAELAGRFRVYRLCDLLPPAWFESDFYRDMYLANDMRDAVFVGVPVSPDCESYVMLARACDHAAFTPLERDAVGTCVRGMKWFHQRLLLSHGLLVASQPLNHEERAVLGLLLTEASDEAVALTRGSEQIRALYRRFGVEDRIGLMALWLGQRT